MTLPHSGGPRNFDIKERVDNAGIRKGMRFSILRWKVAKVPKGDEEGVRFILRSPGGAVVQAMVGKLDKSVSHDALKKNQNIEPIVQQLLDFTIENVHRKTSKEIGAKEMVAQKKERVPSNTSLQLFISTVHKLKSGRAIVISGLSAIPFDKPLMVSFIMNVPVDRKLATESETLKAVFNSFHITGEKPSPR